METEGREGEDESPDEEDVSEDRMRAKPKRKHKDRDGNLEKGERNSQGTGVRTKPSAI